MDPQNVKVDPQNVKVVPQNVKVVPQNVNDVTNGKIMFNYETRYRCFSRKDNLARHVQNSQLCNKRVVCQPL